MNWLEERKRQIAEERRQQELDANGGIELRYKSEKEAQKAYERVKEEIEGYKLELERDYSPKAIEKHIQIELESEVNKIRAKYEAQAKRLKDRIVTGERIMKNILDQAKKDGFTINRSEETDFEVRARDPRKALQEVMDYAEEAEALFKQARKLRDQIEMCRNRVMRMENNAKQVLKELKDSGLDDDAEDYYKDIQASLSAIVNLM